MSDRDHAAELAALFPQGEVTCTHGHEHWVHVEPGALHAAIVDLRTKLGIAHLTTIVGEDLRDHFLLSYVLAAPGVVVVLKVQVDRVAAEVPSLAPVLTGALVYERELHDLLGIVPVGHPDLRRQSLPEDWPAGVYPLRKDAVIPGMVPEAAAPEEAS
jgi:Ni,Fe-hydrogenase III component G